MMETIKASKTRKELYDMLKDDYQLYCYVHNKTGKHYTNVKTVELEKLCNEWKEKNDNNERMFNEQHYDGLHEIVKNINQEIARLMNIRDMLTNEAYEFSYHVGLDIPF